MPDRWAQPVVRAPAPPCSRPARRCTFGMQKCDHKQSGWGQEARLSFPAIDARPFSGNVLSEQPAAMIKPPASPAIFGDLNPSPRLLMGPGPINVDPRVLRAMSM